MALAEIIARKRVDVASRMEQTPLEAFHAELLPSDRSFTSALRQTTVTYILECKKASPTAGLLRPDFDVAAIAREYADTAAAISVLTDEPYFQGSHEFLRSARAVVDLPILCKDFVVDPYQVFEARHFGADAILLMLSVLDDATYNDCFAAAQSLNIDVLTEVHDSDELDRALDLNAPIIGINNRNLNTLEVDTSTTETLAPMVPADRIVICESGMHHHQQIRHLRQHVDGFLVGSAMMSQPRPAIASRELIYGRVKVCGLTKSDDAVAAWRSGASFGGLIFAEESPRFITPQCAAGVCAAAPLKWVGVFVNSSLEHVVETANELSLFAVQLHGEEDQTYIESLRRALANAEIWKACSVSNALPRLVDSGADRLVLDALCPVRRGGTGTAFDWSLLDGFAERDKLIVAGGLKPENVAKADAIGVWGLDVSSGVESRPGSKDETRLRSFFAELRGHNQRGDR